MLEIYNTLTREKNIFNPLQPKKIKFYACGVTVYDYCHLGHARTYTAIDVIVRYLRFCGFDVNYVRNITDIDDKIIKRANENHETFEAVAKKFTQAMHEDFAALGLVEPNHEPRATEYITQMIGMIETIMANKHAYIGQNGDVYFDVRSFASYGCLSHHDIDQLESGARVEVSEVKKDPLDFVLWKLAKPLEPAWDSPWGHGRPGWHIECSAMSSQLLGSHFDIHAGGRDLIFPHHENERAQSQAAQDTPFVNVWMHTGFLQMEKEKMSKSLGNFITIRDVLAEYKPEVLRFLFMSSHYRSPLIYTKEALSQSKQSLARIYLALRSLPFAHPLKNTSYEEKFMAAMDDDFNTPIAISVLFDLAHEVQRLRDKDLSLAAAPGALLKYLGNIIGILETNPDVFFKASDQVNTVKIEELIQARLKARQDKDWSQADQIRDELVKMRVMIEDGPQGTTWRIMD